LRSSLKANVASLAWELQPRLADLALNRQCSQPMKEFIEANKPALQAEVERRRSLGQSVLSRLESSECPLTQAQWINWFRKNQDQFYQGMREAGHKRRAANRRLQASADTPLPVTRVRPCKTTGRPGTWKPWQQILHRRSGWYLLKEGTSEVRLLFVFTFKGHSHCMDFSLWRRRRGFCIEPSEGINLDDIIISLSDIEGDVDAVVMQAEVDMQSASVRPGVFSAAPAPAAFTAAHAPDATSTPAGQVCITVLAASVLKEPLRRSRRARKRKTMDSTAAADVSCSSDSDEEVVGISSESSLASVDTDMESGVDDFVDAKDAGGALDVEEEDVLDTGAEVPGPGSDTKKPEVAKVLVDEDIHPSFRHPAGTWKIWESPWFYVTKTPGFSDVKCHVKRQFHGVSEGMGISSLSRTLTPYHYGDLWEEPWKTMLLLRSWSIWRARWQGWARAKNCRLREVARQVERLVVDLRTGHGDHDLPLQEPLLGSTQAHRLLVTWTPDAVAAVMASDGAGAQAAAHGAGA
jgi:hypothetical protein